MVVVGKEDGKEGWEGLNNPQSSSPRPCKCPEGVRVKAAKEISKKG